MNVSEVFHIDHLHPRAAFDKKLLNKASFLQDDEHLMAFYRNPVHWNAIPNLHLLNHSQNLAKKDRPLKEWLSDQNVHLTPGDLLIENVDLEFTSFKILWKLVPGPKSSIFETQFLCLKSDFGVIITSGFLNSLCI